MAAQNTTRTDGPEQPVKETQNSPITVHSSWSEIRAELKHIQAELNQLKNDEVLSIG